jgi:type II secretory pathway component PulF
MASALEHGAELRDIPARWQNTLPRESALAIRVGVDAGDLTGALQATAYASGFDRSMLQPVIGRFAYLGVVGFYLVTILMFLFIKIIPSFVKIFDDFGTALPEVTRWLIFFANAIVSAWPLVTLLALGLLFVAPIYIWLQWRGTFWPRIPAVRRVVNWIDMAPVLRMFALATARSRPLSTVIRAVAEHHPKRSMRSRMWPVAFATDDGLPWQEALVRQHLLSTEDVALLSAAQRSGNLHWALREMATDYERRAATRLQAVSQIALPLLILPIGLVVAWVVLALFAPIVQLISGLA